MERNKQTELLRREWERCPLPEQAVNARLRLVYAGLPESLPVRRGMPRWVKRGLCTAAGLLAACGLMLGVNHVDPALAESLPFVGSIFQAVNDAGHRLTENGGYAQSALGAYAEAMAGEGARIEIPSKNPMAAPMWAALQEVYYDGAFVFAGLEVRLDADGDRLTERFGPGYDILINGESQMRHAADGLLDYPPDYGNGFCDMSDYFLTRLGPGRYALQRAFRVPDSLQGAESLDITLSFEGFDIPMDNGGFTLDFTAQRTEVPTRFIEGGVEQNGIRLVSASASPTVTCIITEAPESYVNPAGGAIFDDGLYIGGQQGGSTDIPLGNGMVRTIEVYAGLRETEERCLVWSLFDKNGSYQYEAVFVLDFQNGTARVGSREDLKEPPIGDYACGPEALEALTEGYIVEKYHVSQAKPTLQIASGSGKREDLYVEIWQEGRLVDSTDTTGTTGWNEHTCYWEYGPDGQPDRDDETGPVHSSWLLLLPDSYARLDLEKPLTVKARSPSGRLVLEEEIQLTIRN